MKASIGVKQGGPMSCALFIIYLSVLAVMIRALGNDSFLRDFTPYVDGRHRSLTKLEGKDDREVNSPNEFLQNVRYV